jgi:SAM-dependent methyltransferase
MSFQNGGSSLSYTGERVVPGKTPTLQFVEHLLRYRFAARSVVGTKVLDVACGTGFGSSILAEKAGYVVGIDNSFETIQYAYQNYSIPNLSFSVADCRMLPMRSRSFDLAVMFEAIEHISDPEQCLSEIRRILHARGILIISTPNATRPMKAIEEHNPFHLKEFTEGEFLELLRPHFRHVQLLYQHEFSASAIQQIRGPANEPATVVEDSTSTEGAKYFIAVCGSLPAHVHLNRTLGVVGINHQIAIVQDLRHLQEEIETYQKDHKALQHEMQVEVAAHQQVIDTLRGEKETCQKDLVALQQEFHVEVAAHQQVIRTLREENETCQRDLVSLQQEFHVEVAAHQQVIKSLQEEIQALQHDRDAIIRDRDKQIEVRDRRLMELDWLYRWIPTNRVARKLLYGRNLRKRLMALLGLRS